VQDAEKAKKAVDFLSSYKAEIESAYTDKIKDLEEKVRNLSLRGNTPLATANTHEVKRHNPTII
jgi:Mg-chelatase subunit ChlD